MTDLASSEPHRPREWRNPNQSDGILFSFGASIYGNELQKLPNFQKLSVFKADVIHSFLLWPKKLLQILPWPVRRQTGQRYRIVVFIGHHVPSKMPNALLAIVQLKVSCM